MALWLYLSLPNMLSIYKEQCFRRTPLPVLVNGNCYAKLMWLFHTALTWHKIDTRVFWLYFVKWDTRPVGDWADHCIPERRFPAQFSSSCTGSLVGVPFVERGVNHFRRACRVKTRKRAGPRVCVYICEPGAHVKNSVVEISCRVANKHRLNFVEDTFTFLSTCNITQIAK